jgi:hypothetical protein
VKSTTTRPLRTLLVLPSLLLPVVMISLLVLPYKIDDLHCTSLLEGSDMVISNPPTAQESAGAGGSNLCEYGIERWLLVLAILAVWIATCALSAKLWRKSAGETWRS